MKKFKYFRVTTEADGGNGCDSKDGDSQEKQCHLACEASIKYIDNMKSNGNIDKDKDHGYSDKCEWDGNDVRMRNSRCFWESKANYHVGYATGVFVRMSVESDGWNWEDDDHIKVWIKRCTSASSGCDNNWDRAVYHNDLDGDDQGWASHTDLDHGSNDKSSSQWEGSTGQRTFIKMDDSNKRYLRIKAEGETDSWRENAYMKKVQVMDASLC